MPSSFFASPGSVPSVDEMYEKVSLHLHTPFSLGVMGHDGEVSVVDVPGGLLTISFVLAEIVIFFLGYAAWTRRRCLQTVAKERTGFTEPVGYSPMLLILIAPIALHMGFKISAHAEGRRQKAVALTLVLITFAIVTYAAVLYVADKRPTRSNTHWKTSMAWRVYWMLIHAILCVACLLDHRVRWGAYTFVSFSMLANLSDKMHVVFASTLRALCMGRQRSAVTLLLFKHYGLPLRQIRETGVSLKEIGRLLRHARQYGRRAKSITIDDVRKAGYTGLEKDFEDAGFTKRRPSPFVVEKPSNKTTRRRNVFLSEKG